MEESEWIRSIEVLDAGGLGLDRKWPVQESIQWESVGQGDHQRPKKLKKPGVRLFSFLLLKKRLGCQVHVHVYSGVKHAANVYR